MTVDLQIMKTDEIAMLVEKYKVVIINMIILLKRRSDIDKNKLANDIQAIRCISQVLQSIYISHEKLIILLNTEGGLIDYEREYINSSVHRFRGLILNNLL